MTIEDLEAETLTGRLAPHVQAITTARARGIRWKQIRAAIGASVGIDPGDPDGELKLRRAYYRSAAQVAAGKLQAAPSSPQGTPAGTTRANPSTPGHRPPPPPPRGTQDPESFFNSLPSVNDLAQAKGGNQ